MNVASVCTREVVTVTPHTDLSGAARLMRENGLVARRRRAFKATTDSRHGHPVAKNLLKRAFEADAPDRAWVGDITYVPTAEGWLYLAGVIDLCSRKIVGWSMADHMRTDLVADALRMARARRSPGKGLLHHSDRGVRYLSVRYSDRIAANGDVGIGNSSPGALLDVQGNAVIVGSDISATSRTTGVIKLSRISAPPFTTGNLNFAYVAGATTSTENITGIGGAAGGFSAATSIVFHTAANTNTDFGTERMRIN